MSEPCYAESYEVRELEQRVELLEALHAGGLTVAEQHRAMLRLLRQLAGYFTKYQGKDDQKYIKKQVDELLAGIDGR